MERRQALVRALFYPLSVVIVLIILAISKGLEFEQINWISLIIFIIIISILIFFIELLIVGPIFKKIKNKI